MIGHGEAHSQGKSHAAHGGSHNGNNKDYSKMKNIVFIAIVLIFFSTALFFVFYRDAVKNIIIDNWLWLLLLAVWLFLIWKWDYILVLSPHEKAVVYRFGKVNRVTGPGWCFIFPPIETYTKVDLRTNTIDIPKQEIITKDNIELKIDAVIYIKVNDDNESIKNSVMKIDDYKRATELLITAKIRDIFGSMTWEEAITQVEQLNEQLKKSLEEAAKDWGIVCERVEIKDIDVPETLLKAMHEEKAAVQETLAKIERAKGHVAEIEAIKKAAEDLSDRALAYYYIKALEKLGEGKSTKFLFPMELSRLASLLAPKSAGTGDGGTQGQGNLEELFKKYAPVVKGILAEEQAPVEEGKKSQAAKTGNSKTTTAKNGKKK